MSDPWQVGTLYRLLEEFRRLQDEMQVAALERLVRGYGVAYQATQEQFMLLVNRVAADIAAGQTFSVDRLRRLTYYDDLMRDLTRRLADYSIYASQETLTMQRQALQAAIQQTEAMIQAAIADDLVIYPNAQGWGALPPGWDMERVSQTFHRLPAGALDAFIGYAGDGTPLREYFLTGTDRVPALTADVVDRIEQALIKSLATGMNPRSAARLFDNAMGVGLERALRIARTETNRAFRLANQETYRENEDVVEGWRWNTALSPTTCAACVAMDGTVHPLSEEMHDHPNGRCTPTPVTIFGKGKEPLRRVKNAAGEYEFFRGDGQKWFEAQPDAVKEQILGKGGFAAYQEGKVKLGDFVGTQHSETFGDSVVKASLRDIVREV